MKSNAAVVADDAYCEWKRLSLSYFYCEICADRAEFHFNSDLNSILNEWNSLMNENSTDERAWPRATLKFMDFCLRVVHISKATVVL